MAVLNSVGLNLRVGLSSEDPMVGRVPSEPYGVYLSIYSPEGILIERRHLGEIQPERRRFFDITTLTRELVHTLDHLTVVHRIPSRLVANITNLEDEIEIENNPDYTLFRSLVEYSFPGGGNGSVIYETPHMLNSRPANESTSTNTFTFTCQTVLTESLNTHVALINYSTNPKYSTIADFEYGLYSLTGELVYAGTVPVGPFMFRTIDLRQIIPADVVQQERDPQDGMSAFNLIGYCNDASILVVVINASPELGAVGVEHTHPPQAYLFPKDVNYRRTAKADACRSWKSLLLAERHG